MDLAIMQHCGPQAWPAVAADSYRRAQHES